MSNLGSYQTMVTLAKQFGSPERLGLAIFGLGGICAGAVCGIVNHFKRKAPANQANPMITVTSTGTDGSNTTFHEGDTCRILYSDEDMALVEIIGSDDNPHMVSREFLRSVSNY
ncbi:MAG: hypothetical protein ACI3VA_00970 [Candidatus Limivicinus sp.]